MTAQQFQRVDGEEPRKSSSSFVQRRWRAILLVLGGAVGAASVWLLPITYMATALRSSRLCHAVGCYAPRRLRIRGSLISLPGRTEPTLLRGFNIVLKHGEAGLDRLTRQDRLLFKLLPHTTLVRLVVNHWADDVTAPGTDCYDDTAEDYLRSECVALLESAVDWVTNAGAFAVITARSALAAGDAGANASVFDNATLRAHWITMWGAVARRFASTDNIAGYEVMSEPRTFAPFDVVHAAQREACEAVWVHDPRAACVIGAARFYNRFRLNASLLIRGGGPVLYATNFFEPKVWVSSRTTAATNASGNASREGWYGEGGHDCCQAYQKDEASKLAVCGARSHRDCETAPTIRIDRSWLEFELRDALAFRAEHDVPVWIVRSTQVELTPGFMNRILLSHGHVAGSIRRTRGCARRDGPHRALPRRRAGPVRGRGAPLDLLDLAKTVCPERPRRLGLRRLLGGVPAGGGRAVPDQRAAYLGVGRTNRSMSTVKSGPVTPARRPCTLHARS